MRARKQGMKDQRRQPFLQSVLYAIGALSCLTALSMIPPFLTDLGHNGGLKFVLAISVSLFFGGLFLTTNWSGTVTLGVRQTFLLTSGTWIAIGLIGSLPFMVGENALSFTDSVFESVSAITTTGATVIENLEAESPGVLLWRAEMQWIGGVGIIVLGIAILPALNVGGLQLFRTESSDRLDKALPRVGDIAINIGWIYIGMTVLTLLALFVIAKLSFFDALCHALTSVSTAGFSTRTASIGAFDSVAVEIILMIAMIAGVLPFSRYIAGVRGSWSTLWNDSQVRTFMLWLFIAIVAMIMWRVSMVEAPISIAIREAAFNTVSIVTTTGYASADYSTWGPFAMMAFFCFMWVGGCIGSTTGGLKIFRFQIMFIAIRVQLVALVAPWRVQMPEYGGQTLSERAMLSATGYIALTFLFFLGVTLILTFMELDLITAMSAAASALMNIGPGLGEVIGPSGSYATLPGGAKWVLIVSMLLGRLEFFTALVMLHPNFWRT